MKSLSKLAKKIYSLYGLPLTILTGFVAIAILIIYIGSLTPPPPCNNGFDLPLISNNTKNHFAATPTPNPSWYQDIDMPSIFGELVVLIILVTSISSLAYLLFGSVLYFKSRFIKKQKGKLTTDKILILRGILGIVLMLLALYIFNIELSLFHLCL